MPPARRFRDDVEVKSFPRRAVAVPSVPSALSFFFCLLRRRRRHRHVQSTLSLSLSLSLEHTRKSRASSSSVVGKRVVVGVVVVVGGVPSRVCPSREKSPRRSRVSFKEEQKVISSENPKPYTPIFRVLNSEKKKFFFLFLRRKKDDITQTKAVPNRCSPPPARRAHHH